MRKAAVLYKDIHAGTLVETDEGEYTFQYDTTYIENYPTQFLSFTMPVTDKIYDSSQLFPFFEGLIPEGWLLEVASKNWKIKANDRMGLLLACCQNCIGAVSVLPIIDQDEDN